MNYSSLGVVNYRRLDVGTIVHLERGFKYGFVRKKWYADDAEKTDLHGLGYLLFDYLRFTI